MSLLTRQGSMPVLHMRVTLDKVNEENAANFGFRQRFV